MSQWDGWLRKWKPCNTIAYCRIFRVNGISSMRNFIEGIGRLRERRRRAVWVSSDQQWVIVGALRRFSTSTSFSTRRRGREFVYSDRSMPSTRDCAWPTVRLLWLSIRVPRTQSDTRDTHAHLRTRTHARARRGDVDGRDWSRESAPKGWPTARVAPSRTTYHSSVR